MLYVEFLKWVGKQGLKSKVLQKYLNKAWQEGTKGGKVILKTHFPKLLNKAKEYHEGFKRAGLEVVKPIKVPEQTKNILNIKSTLGGRPVKVTKIPTSYKTPPVQPKRIPLFANPTSQEAMIFFREYGKKQQGIYGPFGRGTDGFRNMMQWVGVNSPKEVMKVMKKYVYKHKVVHKEDGGRIDKSLTGRSRDI